MNTASSTPAASVGSLNGQVDLAEVTSRLSRGLPPGLSADLERALLELAQLTLGGEDNETDNG
ncbi:hypothetical protein [Viridibacterium curvum]|uniref:hypothetical protein n=1 Tax=Viridibacterium curvum TaxID=1101404 RepID=UPI0031EC9B57